MNSSAWTLTRDADGIAQLVLDIPGRSANTLGAAVLRELGARMEELERSTPRGLVIRSGKASGFIAGADINEFTSFATAEDALASIRLGQGLCDRIAALPCSTVALLHGFALGGGMEL